MENLSKYILFLATYHLIFFRKFYRNINILSTSEIASTFFPHWIWTGRQLRARKSTLTDNLYYYYPGCIPFLSTFYPWHWISAFFTQRFNVYGYGILLHFLLGSILAYHSLLQWFRPEIALFGAISLTYSAYFIKPLTPCAVYSHAWVMGALSSGSLGAISLGMALLSGYYPTLVYILPILIYKLGFMYTIVGIIIGLPQIIPFLWYWPKSIRSGVKPDPNIGKVPLWRYLDLIFPNRTQNTINGIFWPEMAMFCGIIPLLILTGLKGIVLNVWIVAFMLSFILRIQRIPARSLYLFSISLIMIAITVIQNLSPRLVLFILFIQSLLLLQNVDIYPHFPFCQWWLKPKDWLARAYWPSYKAYMLGIPSEGYKGGFALKSVMDSND